MDFKWLEDMLASIGIKKGDNVTPGHPEYKKIENEIMAIEKENVSIERQLSEIKRRKNLFGSASGILFMIMFFIFHSLWGAIITSAAVSMISDYMLKDRAAVLKNRLREGNAVLKTKRLKLEELNRMLSSSEKEYSRDFGKYVEADFSEENEEEKKHGMGDATASEVKDELRDRYPDSTPEARIAYKNLETVSEKLPELEKYDAETAGLFRGVFESAMKTAKFIHGQPEKEGRAYLFYNHVETLEKWCSGILELEEKDVYDSLLVNVKSKAKEALPVLQEKINKEYYRFVNPDIADLESEMTVMSKEVY